MGQVDHGDTAWVLASAALVLFMTPGLALFYGGLVRTKNVLATMMHSFAAIAVVSALWLLVGYTLAFGPDVGHVIGGLDHLGFHGVGAVPSPLAPTIPHTAFAAFQLMFAVITPALIAGAFAERVRFGGFLLFIGAWSLLIYAPLAHWVWGGGLLGADGLGALDFAGGTVVHISAGAAALATALYVGRRRGSPNAAFVPHDVPMVMLGAGILWFGWFGFNAGSALAAGGLASSAFIATHMGAAAGGVGWALLERWRHGKVTAVGAVSGAVAGLVAITPAAGFVTPLSGFAIGLVAGGVCWLAVESKRRFGYDDALDVVGVHLVGGIAGALLTGVLASAAILPGVESGLAQLGRQAAAVGVAFALSFLGTLAIVKVVDVLVGFRATAEAEDQGIDLAEHGEQAYPDPGRAVRVVAAEGAAEDIDALRERLVLEATERVLERVGRSIEIDES
jgi:Amt family ammonium transporter